MQLSKLGHPFTQEEGPKHQKHITMNVHVLSNLLAQFHHNEQREIARAKRHITLELDRLQIDLQYTPEVHRSALIKLTLSHILRLLGMIAWDVGATPFNVQAKLKHDEDLAFVIQVIRTRYAKALKSVWMERDWKFTSHKKVKRKENSLFTQCHDFKMIHG
jgi:hypothetical protein